MSYANLTLTAKILFNVINKIFFILFVKFSIGKKQNQYMVYYGLRKGKVHSFTLWGRL